MTEMKKNISVTSSPSSCPVVVIAFLTTSLIVVFSSWPAGVHCQELVRGKVGRMPPWENSNSHDDLPTGPRATFPSSLKVHVRLDDSPVRLRLTQNSQFESLPPVYIMSDTQGVQQNRWTTMEDTEFAVYQDLENEGVFGVVREKDENGTSRYKLQGVVHSKGKAYSLQSVREHSGSEPGLSGQGNDDDASDDANGGDGSTLEEGEEVAEEIFEVTELQVKAAADTIRTWPGQDKKKATMMKEEPEVGASIPSATAQPPGTPDSPPKRRKREEKQDIYVDVVAVADYGVYMSWYNRTSGATAAQKEQNTLQDIRRYYAIVMTGVDLLYKGIDNATLWFYTMNVRLVGLMIFQTASKAYWIEKLRTRPPELIRDAVADDSVLEGLIDWAENSTDIPVYDHIMLFSGYDLAFNTTGTINTDVSGIANPGTVCEREGASVVEDLGGFQCIFTAAHELGHGLSARHDGDGNPCKAEDNFIMAPSMGEITPANKLNPWRFSYCSIVFFSVFIESEGDSDEGVVCLFNSLPINSTIPNVTSILPGQLYSPDEQCRQIYGNDTWMCREETEDICIQLYCYDPAIETCTFHEPVRGTTCGSKRWCIKGQCVGDPAAPIVNDNCMFGDQPGNAFGADCATIVNAFPGDCYNSDISSACCASCARHFRQVTDCEYGDKSENCSSAECAQYTLEKKQECCGTCNYGTPFTITPATTLKRQSLVSSSFFTSGTCVDSATYTFNQMTCPSLAEQHPEHCYNATVKAQCCKSCRDISTSTKDCEYGDRDPSQCSKAQISKRMCVMLRSACCKTCAGYGGSSSSVVIVASISSTLVATCVTAVLILWH